MRKLISLLFVLVLFCSCEDSRKPSSVSEYTNKNSVNYVTITSNTKKFDYEKIKLDGHDFYFRTWSTKYGEGSDLVHNPNCSCGRR